MREGFIRFLSRDVILVKGDEEFTYYQVNVRDRVCTCKSYIHRSNCKHLNRYQEFAVSVPSGWTEQSGKYIDGIYHFTLKNAERTLDFYFDRYGYRRHLNSQNYFPSIQQAL
jgi:hypothetical protein